MDLVLRGPFTTHDLGEIAETLRRIERRQPGELFCMIADDQASQIADGVMEKIFPYLQDAPPPEFLKIERVQHG